MSITSFPFSAVGSKLRSPDKDYAATLKFLYGLQSFGIKLGLENIGRLLEVLDTPQEKFDSVHIAGTNGKGSTAAMIAAGLSASGYRTGLYTSPHLVRFNERIRIDGADIPDEALVRYTRLLRSEIIRRRATFFEATTAIAFAWFAERKVDMAVVEVGLGGLYDATNILKPLVSVITSIGLDHMEYLGDTVGKIAAQKGGIIKPHTPVVIGRMPAEAAGVLRKIARHQRAPLLDASRLVKTRVRSESLSGICLEMATKGNTYEGVELALAGRQQVGNATAAILVLERLRDIYGYTRIQSLTIRTGFAQIRKWTGLRGRMEILRVSPLIIGDVAHNPQAVSNLCTELRRLVPARLVTVFGVMQDKDYPAMIRVLRSQSRVIIATEPGISRALSADKLCSAIHDQEGRCRLIKRVPEAVTAAIEECRESEVVLLTGSHYLLGEALDALISGKS